MMCDVCVMCVCVCGCVCDVCIVCVGEVLVEMVTNQAPNTCAVVSPCGTFIATAGEYSHSLTHILCLQ